MKPAPARRIEHEIEATPPNHYERDPRLFSDVDDDDLTNRLLELWSYGIVKAKWSEEKETSLYKLTDFGEELARSDLTEAYLSAMRIGESIESSESPAVVEADL